MRYLIIAFMLICGIASAEICCSKWDGTYGGLKNGKATAWTNEGLVHQIEIKYCPECGKKLILKQPKDDGGSDERTFDRRRHSFNN